MGKVAIYARVSTLDKQDYTRQIDELTTIIIQSGYSKNDIDVYAESISGFKVKDERPKLAELIDKIEANKSEYDCIYTSEISRIGRNPNQTRQIIDRWTELGVPLFIQSLKQKTIENGARNAVMNIILQVLMEYANIEAETFKTRSKSGLRASAITGKVGGGVNYPYGYKNENGFLVIDESEAPVIMKIFDLYSEGYGSKMISGILNEMETPTRANLAFPNKEIKFENFNKLGKDIKWSDTQIRSILTNTIYKGERRFKGEIIKTTGIISAEKFNHCTDIRQSKTHRNYLTTYVYLLKDIIICGCCGRNYFAKYKPVIGGDKVYICSSRLKLKGNCGNYGVNITLIESAIFNEIFNNDLIVKYINDSNRLVINLKAEIVQLKQRLPIEENILKNLNESFERLEDLYINKGGIIYKNYEVRYTKIQNDISNAVERINKLKKTLLEKKASLQKFNTTKATRETLIKAKENRADLQALYKQFIYKVIVTKQDIDSVSIGVYLQINEVKLANPMLILLDLKSIKKRNISYRYKALYNDNSVNDEGDVFEMSDFDFIGWTEIQKNELITL